MAKTTRRESPIGVVDAAKEETWTSVPVQQQRGLVLVLLLVSGPVVHRFPLTAHLCGKTNKHLRHPLTSASDERRRFNLTLPLRRGCQSPPEDQVSVLPPVLRRRRVVSAQSVYRGARSSR